MPAKSNWTIIAVMFSNFYDLFSDPALMTISCLMRQLQESLSSTRNRKIMTLKSKSQSEIRCDRHSQNLSGLQFSVWISQTSRSRKNISDKFVCNSSRVVYNFGISDKLALALRGHTQADLKVWVAVCQNAGVPLNGRSQPAYEAAILTRMFLHLQVLM